MRVNIESSWKTSLADEFSAPYFKDLSKHVKATYLSNKTVFPPPRFIFNAFSLCPYNQTRVVILGQDPYHGLGQAHGLCFSVPTGIKVPPSLQNIYKEIVSDLGVPSATNGDLSSWARQGVLLLNATLTVEAAHPGSHQGLGWERFTDAVIKKLSDEKEHLIFILWGRSAQAKGAQINATKHLVLKAAHPSPLSAHNGFFGCRHFSQTNIYLEKYYFPPIIW